MKPHLLHTSPWFVSLVGLLVLATPADAQRGSNSGSRGSSSPSRPSSAPQSRPSAPQVSRPSSPSPGRGSASPAPISRPAPQPAPSYDRGSSGGSRGTTSVNPNPPRGGHDQPAVRSYDTGRTAPAPSVPSGGSSYDRGGSSAPSSRGSTGSVDTPRVWQPRDSGSTVPTVRDSSGLDTWSRTPRTPIPVLSGSLSRDRGPGAERLRAAEDLLRRDASARRLEGSPSSRRGTSIGAPVLPREGLLDRYRGGESARTSDSRVPELSRQRLGGSSVSSGERSAVARSDRASSRVISSPSRAAERETARKMSRERVDEPAKMRRVDAASTAISRASNVTTAITLGVGLGFGCGTGGLWFWDPSHPSWGHGGHGHGWGYGWGHGYGYGYGGWGWGWGFGNCSWWWWPTYSSYWCSSWYWGSPWWSSPSYAWCPSPYAYSTVIYVDDPDPAPVVVYEEAPAAAPVEVPAAVPEGDVAARPAGVIVPPAAPSDLSQSMARGASEYLAKGDGAFREGRYGDAVQHYARAVEYAPNDGLLWLILSDALFATGDYHYCAFALRKALELDAQLLGTVVDKTGFYANPADFSKQLALAESYLQEHFLDEDARLVLAANYLFSNRPAQALDLLESAFSLGVRESPAGKLLLERAKQQKDARAK